MKRIDDLETLLSDATNAYTSLQSLNEKKTSAATDAYKSLQSLNEKEITLRKAVIASSEKTAEHVQKLSDQIKSLDVERQELLESRDRDMQQLVTIERSLIQANVLKEKCQSEYDEEKELCTNIQISLDQSQESVDKLGKKIMSLENEKNNFESIVNRLEEKIASLVLEKNDLSKKSTGVEKQLLPRDSVEKNLFTFLEASYVIREDPSSLPMMLNEQPGLLKATDKNGRTLLHEAIRFGKINSALLIINRWNDLDDVLSLMQLKDKDGMNVLALAEKFNRFEIIQVLQNSE